MTILTAPPGAAPPWPDVLVTLRDYRPADRPMRMLLAAPLADVDVTQRREWIRNYVDPDAEVTAMTPAGVGDLTWDHIDIVLVTSVSDWMTPTEAVDLFARIPAPILATSRYPIIGGDWTTYMPDTPCLLQLVMMRGRIDNANTRYHSDQRVRHADQ